MVQEKILSQIVFDDGAYSAISPQKGILIGTKHQHVTYSTPQSEFKHLRQKTKSLIEVWIEIEADIQHATPKRH